LPRTHPKHVTWENLLILLKPMRGLGFAKSLLAPLTKPKALPVAAEAEKETKENKTETSPVTEADKKTNTEKQPVLVSSSSVPSLLPPASSTPNSQPVSLPPERKKERMAVSVSSGVTAIQEEGLPFIPYDAKEAVSRAIIEDLQRGDKTYR